jgi:hypothetical protein
VKREIILTSFLSALGFATLGRNGGRGLSCHGLETDIISTINQVAKYPNSQPAGQQP